MSKDVQDQQERSAAVPTLEELTAACEPARQMTAERDEAKAARNQAVRDARVQGARKKELQEAAEVSPRTAAYLIADVKPAPQLGVAPDLQAVKDAAARLAAAEDRLILALNERDEQIYRARTAKKYTMAQIMGATGLSRSTIYKT